MPSRLAVHGGESVRREPWPPWPRATRSTETAVLKVLRSERWTISGPCLEEPLFERRFAEDFAHFHGLPYCVPTANGSAALTIALEALGVSSGQEVLVPGLTWVACGAAVSRVGATPVLVDVDPQTLCMSLDAARRAITPATTAIMLVHLYCGIADIEGFVDLTATTGINLIEDCSHAHGAVWRGQRVGTFGVVSAFSMQQSKVLTSGEGGAVITRNPDLYDRLQQLRADGRRYTARRCLGASELEDVGALQGHNYCLSEFHSAILVDRLPFLDEENAIRLENAIQLTNRLRQISKVRPLHDSHNDCKPTFYRYIIRFDRGHLGRVPIELVAAGLTAELRIPVQPIYEPLNQNPLFPKYSPPRSMPGMQPSAALYDPTHFSLPVAAAARIDCLGIPHNMLLGGRQEVDDIATAVEKVLERKDELLPDYRGVGYDA